MLLPIVSQLFIRGVGYFNSGFILFLFFVFIISFEKNIIKIKIDGLFNIELFFIHIINIFNTLNLKSKINLSETFFINISLIILFFIFSPQITIFE